ncbi:MAG: ribosome biogenesis factor YjgA [Arenimonas sp.]
MRGVDEETGEYLGPSRGELRREALSVLDLASKMIEQNESRIHTLPMSAELIALTIESKKITSQIARKRQMQFLAKQLRRQDDEVLTAIRAALDFDKTKARQETASLHRVEAWRDRLIEEGDTALAELLNEYPTADRQHIRQLARNAKEEKLKNRPPHAFRDLFRDLRELINDDHHEETPSQDGEEE